MNVFSPLSAAGDMSDPQAALPLSACGRLPGPAVARPDPRLASPAEMLVAELVQGPQFQAGPLGGVGIARGLDQLHKIADPT